MPLLPASFLGSFILTVFLLQWWQRPSYPITVWLTLGGIGLLGFFGLFHEPYRKKASLWVALCLGIVCAFTSVMHASHESGPSWIEHYAKNQKVLLQGTVVGQPDDRKLKVQYRLNTLSLVMSGQTFPLKGQVLLVDRQMWSKFEPGDILRAQGTLELPEHDTDFSYKEYLAVYSIQSLMQSYDIRRIRRADTVHIGKMLWSSKRTFEHTINRIMPEPQSSLLAGLLTGTRAGMPEEVATNFRTVGLTHIVAISGFNITIIISIIGSALFFLPLRWRFVPSVLIIVLFTLFVGASASVVRASITGILGLIALHTGRVSHTRLAVTWTAFMMLIWNPVQLWHDVGFQLSFLAVIGLMELSPILKPLLRKIPTAFGIQEALVATLAAQFTAVPLSLYQFGSMSLISPLANILVAPLIPLAMLCGFIATVLGFFHETIGTISGLPANILLSIIIAIADACARIPYAAIQLTSVPLPAILCYYSLLVATTIFLYKRFTIDTHTHPPVRPSSSAE